MDELQRRRIERERRAHRYSVGDRVRYIDTTDLGTVVGVWPVASPGEDVYHVEWDGGGYPGWSGPEDVRVAYLTEMLTSG